MALGARRFDVQHRAAVVARVETDTPQAPVALGTLLGTVERAVVEGADALALTEREGLGSLVRSLRHRYDIPLAVISNRAECIEEALEGGADVAIVRAPSTSLLERLAAAEASVVLIGPPAVLGRADDVESLTQGAARAHAAGIAPERVVLDAGVHPRMALESVAARLIVASHLHALGHLVSVDAGRRDRPATVALASAASLRGCRVVIASEVRAARRTVDVLAAVASAREDRTT